MDFEDAMVFIVVPLAVAAIYVAAGVAILG